MIRFLARKDFNAADTIGFYAMGACAFSDTNPLYGLGLFLISQVVSIIVSVIDRRRREA